MRTRTVLILLAAVATLVVAGCGESDRSSSGRRVVAAFYPLAFAAEGVAPDADVRNLTPPGAEPHDFELSPRDVAEVRDAERVVYLGRGFMPSLEDAVAGRANAIDVLEGEPLLADRDPHVWLDPARFARIVRRVARSLGDPEAAEPLVGRLATLDREFSAGLEACERREIVTSHAAFGYLADAYDLEQIPLTGVSPESEPGPGQLEELVNRVESEGATTIFFETLVSPELAETVARETDAEVGVLDPLEGLSEEDAASGADYFTVMRENLAALRRALGCR
jgi:zinc transport system substrate-binding protein